MLGVWEKAETGGMNVGKFDINYLVFTDDSTIVTDSDGGEIVWSGG